MAEKKRRAADPEPSPSKKTKRTILPEAAAEKDNFILLRSLDISQLDPRTIKALNKHNYDPFVDDPQVKVIMRSGSISNKCELVESEIKRPYKIIAKADIHEDECVGVYMGQLIEERRCEGANMWQYNIPASLFPKKHRIPPLVVDGSKSANETRFIHNSKWYGKAPNIKHLIVWDVAVHLPQVIFRATCNIKAGNDILLYWDVNELATTNNNDSPNNNNNNSNKAGQVEDCTAKEVPTKAQKKNQQQENNKQDNKNKRQAQEAAKRQAVEKKIEEATERERLAAARTHKLQEAITQSREQQQREAARRKAEIERRRIEIKLADRAQLKLQEEIDRAKAKKIQYGVVHITPKQRDNNKDIRTKTTEPEVDLEEPLEIEPVQAQTQADISKPMTEINFFSEPEIVNNTSPTTSIDSSVITRSSSIQLEDCTFDLNAEIVLSDEEEEPIATV